MEGHTVHYIYRSVLPRIKAHNVYVFETCNQIAQEGNRVKLLCCAPTLPLDHLHTYYGTEPADQFTVSPLFYPFRNSRLFHWQAGRAVRKEMPSCVVTSTLSDAFHQLSRRVQGVRYVHEVHDLTWFPGQDLGFQFWKERQVLESQDHLIATTEQIKTLLQEPPYSLVVPITVAPLASDTTLQHAPGEGCVIGYCGQLYKDQGIDLLLKSLEGVSGVKLLVIGGQSGDVEKYRKIASSLGIYAEFTGHLPPAQIPSVASQCHLFVAPFLPVGKMPYVAHTKLSMYAGWGRRILAPDLPVVHELIQHSHQWKLFQPGRVESLRAAIEKAAKENWQGIGGRLGAGDRMELFLQALHSGLTAKKYLYI